MMTLGKLSETNHKLITEAEDELMSIFSKEIARHVRIHGEIPNIDKLEEAGTISLIGDSALLFSLTAICRNAVRKKLDPVHLAYDNWVINRVEGGSAGQYNPEQVFEDATNKVEETRVKVDSIKAEFISKGLRGILQDYLRANMFIS